MDARLTFRDYLDPIKTDGGTQLQDRTGNGSSVRGRGEPEWQIRRFVCLEKPLRRVQVPVPQTDTGRRDEYSQALG